MPRRDRQHTPRRAHHHDSTPRHDRRDDRRSKPRYDRNPRRRDDRHSKDGTREDLNMRDVWETNKSREHRYIRTQIGDTVIISDRSGPWKPFMKILWGALILIGIGLMVWTFVSPESFTSKDTKEESLGGGWYRNVEKSPEEKKKDDSLMPWLWRLIALVLILVAAFFITGEGYSRVLINLDEQEISTSRWHILPCYGYKERHVCFFEEFMAAQAKPDCVEIHYNKNWNHHRPAVTGSEYMPQERACKLSLCGVTKSKPKPFYCRFRDAINAEMSSLGYHAKAQIACEEWNAIDVDFRTVPPLMNYYKMIYVRYN